MLQRGRGANLILQTLRGEMMSEWIDVTIPLAHGMAHWPGDPDIVVERISNMDNGDMCNVSRLVLSTHTGTHMDAPLHFIKDGRGIDQFPLTLVNTVATVLEITDDIAVTAEELSKFELNAGDVILFKTRNSQVGWTQEFRKDFVYVAPDAAKLLASKGVAMVGIDYMSVGGFFQHSEETHQALLGAGIWLIENLNLQNVKAGQHDMICAPMPISKADGAPVRVLLKPR